MNFNYADYFKFDLGIAYEKDVGSFCTRELIKRFAKGRVLEVGCGINRIFPESDTMDIVGDATYKCFIEDMKVKGQDYDTIIMSHVLEHIKSDFNAIEKCYLLLRKNGKLVVLSPFGKTGICSRKEIERNGHIRRYNRERVSLLERPDFPCIYYQQVHLIHNIVWNRLKYILKAFYYPVKLIDGIEMYDRKMYRTVFPYMVRFLNHCDRFNLRGNALFVFERVR